MSTPDPPIFHTRNTTTWRVEHRNANRPYLPSIFHFPFSISFCISIFILFPIPRGFPQKAGNAIRKVPHGLQSPYGQQYVASPITSWRNREPVCARVYKLAVINNDLHASGHITYGRSRRAASPLTQKLVELLACTANGRYQCEVRSSLSRLQTLNLFPDID